MKSPARCLLTLTVLFALTPVAMAKSDYQARTEARFQVWLTKLWPQAKAAGISRRTFDGAFSGVHLNWRLPDLAPPGRKPPDKSKRRQAEFGSPGRYFREKQINALVRRGRKMKVKWRQTL
ncbi:MAG TPA: lytic murein transglycosylase, partial [Rhizobiales bacterium]|nr:lytic murein transglycosylase [Hyphomicrobiales bacterium]